MSTWQIIFFFKVQVQLGQSFVFFCNVQNYICTISTSFTSKIVAWGSPYSVHEFTFQVLVLDDCHCCCRRRRRCRRRYGSLPMSLSTRCKSLSGLLRVKLFFLSSLELTCSQCDKSAGSRRVSRHHSGVRCFSFSSLLRSMSLVVVTLMYSVCHSNVRCLS